MIVKLREGFAVESSKVVTVVLIEEGRNGVKVGLEDGVSWSLYTDSKKEADALLDKVVRLLKNAQREEGRK